MTAKEQGLPELPPHAHIRQLLFGGPVEKLYTAAQMRAYALAALASDTGGRGVVGLDPLDLANAARIGQLEQELAALRAQPAGGGCESCDGKGFVVRYHDPYSRGDVSSPYDAPCGDCPAPPESGGQGEAYCNLPSDGDASRIVTDELLPFCPHCNRSFDDAPSADSEPVAVRYDGDGYGYRYIDNGSGSDWLRRHKDGEPLYTHPPAQASGAVTEAMVLAACRAHDPMYESCGSDTRADMRAGIRRALGAALRAQPAGGGDFDWKAAFMEEQAARLELHAKLYALTQPATPPESGGQGERKPDGYAYRYPDAWGSGRTVIEFNNGQERNGNKPIEAVPYFFGTHPPAQASVVTEAMVTNAWGEFCCVVDRDLAGKILNGRDAIRAAIIAALAQGGGNER